MTITLSEETQKLIEERMKETGLATPDEVVRMALQSLDQLQTEYFEDLDPEIQAAINQGEADFQRGDCLPAEEVFRKLQEKYRIR